MITGKLRELTDMMLRLKKAEEIVSAQEGREVACQQIQDQRSKQHEAKMEEFRLGMSVMKIDIEHVCNEMKSEIRSVGARVDKVLTMMVEKK